MSETSSSEGGASPFRDTPIAADVEFIRGKLAWERDASEVHIQATTYDYIDDLNDYSILMDVPTARKLALVQAAKEDPLLDRAMGSMCGMAIGDALGHPFEFEPVQEVSGASYFDLKTLEFHGATNVFRLQRGQWTDDASMGLCIADSLIMRGCFHGSDMRVRFWCWWNRGYNNAFRFDKTRTASVGLGGNIAKSLYAIQSLRRTEDVPPAFKSDSEDAGNGSLMRFTPIAIFHHAEEIDEVHRVAMESSYTTHPGIIAALACALLSHLIVRALRRPVSEPPDARRFLEEATLEFLESSEMSGKSGWGYDEIRWLASSAPVRVTERCWDWKNPVLDIAGTLKARGIRYNGYPVSAGYFGSYSLDGLALALWSVYQTRSFDQAVTRSVNLLGDADSHGSITGQLAGALYGYRSVNPEFIRWLSAWDDHEFAVRAVLLTELGSKRKRTPGSGSRRRQVPRGDD